MSAFNSVAEIDLVIRMAPDLLLVSMIRWFINRKLRKNAILDGEPVTWDDVAIDTTTAAYKLRREMEQISSASKHP